MVFKPALVLTNAHFGRKEQSFTNINGKFRVLIQCACYLL